MTTKKIFEVIRSYFGITIGLFISVLGWTGFLLPAKIVGGGVTGVATIIFLGTSFPIGYSILLINAVLILIAIRLLGAKFGIATIYGIGMSSFLFFVLQHFIQEPFVTDQFMSALIGGALAGIGVGITFVNGGNSGGTDIVALIIGKYRNISPGRIFIYLDFVIIGSSFLVYQSGDKPIEKLVYGYVVMAVVSYVIDLVVEGAKQSYQITVFSKQNRIIADRIGNEVGRGITLLNGYGWYSKAEIEVLMVIARKTDKQQIMKIIKETDERAFISVAKVQGVFGMNFDKIKI